MPIDCGNIFEDVDVDLDDHLEITSVCIEALRSLAQRDDFLQALIVLVNDKMMEICEKTNSMEEDLNSLIEEVTICCGYYDYSLEDFVL